MKNVIQAFLSLALLLGAVAAGAQTLSVGSGSATCGSVKHIDVTIGAGSVLESVRFEVTWDSSKLSMSEDPVAGMGLFRVAEREAGKVTFLGMVMDSGVSGPGTVATLAFNVAAGASGTVALNLSGVQINEVDRSGTGGSLTISCSGGGDPPPPPPATGGTISAGTVSGACGTTVEVPVSVGSGSVDSLMFTAAGASGLTLVDAVASGKGAGFLLEKNVESGTVIMLGSAIEGPGEVARLKFSVGASATGSLAVTLSDVKVNGKAAANATGSVTVTCNGGNPNPPTEPTYISPVHESTGIAAPVTLRWNGVSGASTYRVYFGTTNPPPMHNATDRTRLDVATQQGTIYYWSIEAIAAGGKVSGPVWRFTTAGTNCMIPDAPQLLAPAEVASGSTFSLTWSMTTGVTEYVLEQAGDPAFSNAAASTHATSSATLTLFYSNPTTRWFRVRGRNAAAPCSAEGPRSNSVAVRVLPSSTGNSTGPRVIAVAGSLAGSAGSYFRTSLQLHNHTTAMMRGRIVFHRNGVSGSGADPSFGYDLAPGVTQSWSDVVLRFGQSGIGSIDLIATEGEEPLSVARIYNDGGPNGTTGVAVDAVAASDALQPGRRAQLFAPIDPTRARMNIGVRSLGDGATIDFTLRDYAGVVRQSARRSFSPTWFEQFAIGTLFDTVLRGDEVIVVEVLSGSAIVYGSTTDNLTQDPTIQFARAR